MFTPIQQSTALPPLLSDLELLRGVIPLYREHGRGGLRPLNHYLLAQLLFAFAWSILIAGLRETQETFLGIYYCKFSNKKKYNSLGGNNWQRQTDTIMV